MRRLAAVALAMHAVVVGAANSSNDDSVFAHPMAPGELRVLTVAASAQLAGARVIRGEFVQRRLVRGLPQALESRGDFLYAQDIGIKWRTLTPLESQITITPAGMTQNRATGAVSRVAAVPPAATQVVARIFFGLFALDYTSLARDFNTFGEADGAHWRVGLQARRSALGRVFKRAVLAGQSAAESIVLYDAAGNRTEIQLQKLQYEAAPLSAAERARF
jgi:hypothetical protein